MPDGSRTVKAPAWGGVGIHPTPKKLVQGFARAVAASVKKRHSVGSSLNILDACSGDGRLGHAVAKRLVRLGFRAKLTLIEVDKNRVSACRTSYEVDQVIADFYSYPPTRSFDVVVSNPPYLALGRDDAQRLGLEWVHVMKCGRNLYGLALAKALLFCKRDGVFGMLAPHGWLQNWYGACLRELIGTDVEMVDVYASNSRRLFPGVNQDVAAQIFKLRDKPKIGAEAAVRISYDHVEFDNLPSDDGLASAEKIAGRVRVGPFVWNREKEMLSERRLGLPVIYGGNISPDGSLDFERSRYIGRQFAAKTRVPENHISRGPCLLLKRSLRGGPGAWKLDAAILFSKKEFVAENHVIVVELARRRSRLSLTTCCAEAVRQIELRHKHHGHPNVSMALVKRVLGIQLR